MTRHKLMQVLQWRFYRTVERLGGVGLAAIVLLLFVLLAYLLLVRPLMANVAAEELAADGQSEPVAKVKVVTDTDRLNTFKQALPSVAQRTSAIQSFMDVAIAEKLQPNEIAYKTETRAEDPFSHYHVEFSLYAPYADIQHFLSVLLNKLNYVSIEALTLIRESVKDEDVDARVHLVFHFNQQQVGQSSKAMAEKRVGEGV